MTTPVVRSGNDRSNRSKNPEKSHSLSLVTRRFAAWAAEITLVAASGLIPFGLGVYANSKSDLNRVPLNPLLVVTERAIARPLALPVSYGIRNVAWPTNILWSLAIFAPVTLSTWQLYLLARTGSTIPKRRLGVRVVNEQGKAPGFGAVILREGVGRWTVPLSVAYLLWRYSLGFPNLTLFASLALLAIAAESMGLPSKQGRRSFHDIVAGTYTVDANRPLPSSLSVENAGAEDASAEDEGDYSQIHPLLAKIRQNPNLTMIAVALVSMTAVLATLVGTQIYIQTQETLRKSQQINSQQFLELIKQLNPNSTASVEERRTAILAMGTLNDPQAIQFLTDLLVKEPNPTLVDTVQQALVHVGLNAIPELKNQNQFLAGELASADKNAIADLELRQKRLQLNQKAINKILAVYSGKNHGIDMSSTQLGSTGAEANPLFNLVLDNIDLSGIKFKSANLNQSSFRGSRFRSVGEDGRWDTYDDVVADLSQVQMKQANFTDAILSRVIMNRSDLSRATLNRANLSDARLIGANLSSTQLVGADLRGAVLENASLTGADLGDAKLNEADLYGARLGRVTAIGTQLAYANLTKTDWQSSDLSGADLEHANLSNANLTATRLTGAVLRSAQMQNANFQNADLSLVDLRGANVAGADFRGTILSPSKQDPADEFVQTPSKGSVSAVVQGVDFSQAKNLDSKQLAYICTQGGIHPRCP
ncbi:pentapeptide repeat-containing protein [Calothrix sp. FACHB-1219]|uniref:pentapeptide repeat-containing protein n=1 Tax=unclassified Calothrix TaxID=2619626 RepID=UPI0016879631|nr:MULTISPECIES: pentapeptide repeat-containing protein [unclassified Calothrix]MBD2203756.1 pentapeptide repeat-containing protein [Calothrix sp. FACHB-168]MBD2219576.1 pentapeptide repeat-containing protein [Calothrix sp. FACHB-1219]